MKRMIKKGFWVYGSTDRCSSCAVVGSVLDGYTDVD